MEDMPIQSLKELHSFNFKFCTQELVASSLLPHLLENDAKALRQIEH